MRELWRTGVGLKVLLDLFATSPEPLRCRELPFEFRSRFSGENRLDTMVAWEYFIMLSGLVVHLIVLSLLFRSFGISFLAAQSSATMIAIAFNFVNNNVLTCRDMQLRGWLRAWRVALVGALWNYAVTAVSTWRKPRAS